MFICLLLRHLPADGSGGREFPSPGKTFFELSPEHLSYMNDKVSQKWVVSGAFWEEH
jgi:hypothetical protein